MVKGKTFYEEVWECRFPKSQTVEEELFDLQALAPDMIEDLRSLFKEAVADPTVKLLGKDEAVALAKLIAETDLGNPPQVFTALDSTLHEGSRIIKDAVVEEFRVKVHQLLEKVRREIVSHGPTPNNGNSPRRGPST
jgi:hypothetical protein